MRFRLPLAIRWRAGKIGELDGGAYLCRLPVRKRVKAAKVDVVVDGEVKGIGWGQFLDADHHSGKHWGRFGTSAAVQVLAMDLHWTPEAGAQRQIRETHPVNRIADDVLPDSEPPKALPDELKPRDFHDPMKVAFLVDATVPDACDEHVQDAPKIVDVLLSLAIDEEGWSTRPAEDEDAREKDRLLITAYALYVLRRFPKAQTDQKISGAWTWLAQEVIDGAKTMGEDLLALSCLALENAISQVRNETVDEARAKGLAELHEWARTSREPLVTRYYFNGYWRGEDNDYLFLSPELLCSLLFLQTKPLPRRSRAFVLDVVQAVEDNIVPPNLPSELQGVARGFTIQRGMEGTVDQMWAMRLLRTFHLRYRADRRALRPSRISWPSIAIGALVLSIAAVALAAAGWFGKHSGTAIGIALGSAVFGAAASVILLDLRDRRR